MIELFATHDHGYLSSVEILNHWLCWSMINIGRYHLNSENNHFFISTTFDVNSAIKIKEHRQISFQ